MEKNEVRELLRRYASGQVTEEEKALVETWYIHHSPNFNNELPDAAVEEDLQHILKALPAPDKSRVRPLWPVLWAAAILLIFSYAIFLKGDGKQADHIVAKAKVIPPAEIAPGGQRATLILADGSEITLDDASNGEIAWQDNARITKTADGQLVYSINSEQHAINTRPAYNTIQTPRGGQYSLTLPDGTRVWLNAASSLRYPAIFAANERKVELTGEAYFEVVHKKDMPFTVLSSTQTVEVLGTHFNVNTYADEPAVKTTLLEGSVKVLQQSGTQLLKPGQQLQAGKFSKVVNVDAEDVVAWKNGDFIFKDEELGSIMRQVSKWYDVEVDFSKGVDNNLKFSGLVSRSRNISAVLRLMELTNQVHFKVDGRRIIVMP